MMSLPVPLNDLPAYLRDEICGILDSSTEHNWVKLLENIPDEFSYQDLLLLKNLSYRNQSPSEELLRNLGGIGWNVVDLGRAVKKASIGSVVDIIYEFCQDEGIDVDFNGDPPPSEGTRFAAKSCLSRSQYPTELVPPPGGLEEAKRRYNLPDSPAPPPYSEVGPNMSHSVLPGPGATDGNIQREILQKATPITNAVTTQATPTRLIPTATQAAATTQATLANQAIFKAATIPNPSFSDMATSSDTPTSQATPQGAAIHSSSNLNTATRTSSATESSSLTIHTLDTTPTPFRASLSPPPAHLEEVKYNVLAGATHNFDKTPFTNGGHKIGEGGFGEVFQCWLTLREGRINTAVKVLLNKENAVLGDQLDSADRKQFSTEIQALSRLSHPCLLPVLGYSLDGPQLCLVYPYMHNGSLEAHLNDHTSLPPSKRLAIAINIAEGLDYLHFKADNTIIHRDVKSANVLLSEDWKGKLGDFGLARLLSSQLKQDTSIIHTATIVGTRVYMAPETALGKISRRADVYSFGVVLLELLTGKCALHNIEDSTGEETDLVTYVEELEDGDEMALNVGGWEPVLWEKLYEMAQLCLVRQKSRPSSTKVLEELLKLERSHELT